MGFKNILLFDTYFGRFCLMFEILAQGDQYTNLQLNKSKYLECIAAFT